MSGRRRWNVDHGDGNNGKGQILSNTNFCFWLLTNTSLLLNDYSVLAFFYIVSTPQSINHSESQKPGPTRIIYCVPNAPGHPICLRDLIICSLDSDSYYPLNYHSPSPYA